MSALNKLRKEKIEKYLPHVTALVTNILKKYPQGSVDRQEAISSAQVQMTDAFNRFYSSPSFWKSRKKGNDLRVGPMILGGLNSVNIQPSDGYINKAIKASVYDFVRSQAEHNPATRAKISELRAFINKVQQTTNKTPDDSEISKELGWTVDDVKKYKELMTISTTSFDDTINDYRADDFGKKTKDGTGNAGVKPHENPEIMTMLMDEMEKAISVISKISDLRERFVIELKIFEDLSFNEIDEVMGLAHEESRVLFDKGLESIKPLLKDKLNITL